MTFLVATWNLQWQFGNWEERQPAIRATLQALGPDLVMVQESWQVQVEGLAKALGFEYTWAGHDRQDDPDRAMGNAVMSRWPIRRNDFRYLEDNKGRKYRTIVAAQVETPWGGLPAFSTHLDHRFDQSAVRMDQLSQASAFIEDFADGELPPILTGDLNAVPDSDEIRKLTGRSAPYVSGRVWTDAWDQVGYGDGITWSLENPYINNSAWPNRRLDYVLIGWPRDSRPLGNPASAKLFGTDPIEGVVPSDHYGVAVEIHT